MRVEREWIEFSATTGPGQRAIPLVRIGSTVLEDVANMADRAIEPLISVLIAAGVAESLARKRAEEATGAASWLLDARQAVADDAWREELEQQLAHVRARAVELAQLAAQAAREACSNRGYVAALRAIR